MVLNQNLTSFPKSQEDSKNIEERYLESEGRSTEYHDREEVDQDIKHLQISFGKNGKTVLWFGLGLMWTVFELDNATVYSYQNYATSEFAQVSALGTLTTAGIILSAVMKPPVGKLSDVIGRAETYSIAVLLYIISYATCASSATFGIYAGGYIIYCLGQTSMQILNQILVADITSSRFRGLANQLVNLPFMIVPWISAFIVDSALTTVGWRWGIGMFAIILPICSLSVIVPVLIFQMRARKATGVGSQKHLTWAFFSQIDIIGMILLSGGFACILLPLSLAGSAPHRWATPWIPALIAVGVVLLGVCCFYEARLARHPIVPARYARMPAIVLACMIGLLDAFSFSVTHTYMYPWVTVVHQFTPREATFLTFTAGCMQILVGLVAGALMYKFRRFKWILIVGLVIRCIGYGVMMRLRGAENSMAELFIVQLIQGAGSGIIQTIVLVVAQVVVPHSELAQATALLLLFVYLGNGIGSAVAGSIYTNTLADRLRYHAGEATSAETINNVVNTLDTVKDTALKIAVNLAYSDVMRYMTIAALVASAFPLLVVYFMPDLRLSKKHNLADEILLKPTRKES